MPLNLCLVPWLGSEVVFHSYVRLDSAEMWKWKYPYLVVDFDCYFFLITVGCLNKEYQSEFSAKDNVT